MILLPKIMMQMLKEKLKNVKQSLELRWNSSLKKKKRGHRKTRRNVFRR